MKKLLLGFSLLCLVGSSVEAEYVRGYYRKDGTYVAPYYRGGSSYSSPSTTSSISIPKPAPITVYPVSFVGKACGKSRIAKDRVCRVGTPQQKRSGFSNCTEAWENGVQDIPRGSVAYAKGLDRDGDGIACEVSDMYDGTTWLYGIEAAYPINGVPNPKPEGVVAGVGYVLFDALSQLGGVSHMADGSTVLEVGARKIGFVVGSKRTAEGFTLAAPPVLFEGSLLVPVRSTEFLGCTVTPSLDGGHVTECPNGNWIDGPLMRW